MNERVPFAIYRSLRTYVIDCNVNVRIRESPFARAVHVVYQSRSDRLAGLIIMTGRLTAHLASTISIFDLWRTHICACGPYALTFRTRAKERERERKSEIPLTLVSLSRHYNVTRARDLLLVFQVNKRCRTRVDNARGSRMYNI